MLATEKNILNIKISWHGFIDRIVLAIFLETFFKSAFPINLIEQPPVFWWFIGSWLFVKEKLAAITSIIENYVY